MKFLHIFTIILITQVILNSAETFVFSDGTNEFNFRLYDPSLIKHARDLVSGATTSEPSVMGIIINSTACYNSAWSYHLDPATISFFDVATEVCDASISYTEEHLAKVGTDFLPDNRWCPWSSHVIREI